MSHTFTYNLDGLLKWRGLALTLATVTAFSPQLAFADTLRGDQADQTAVGLEELPAALGQSTHTHILTPLIRNV